MEAVPPPQKRARLYYQIRSAHLERAAALPEATILFGRRRYDFDEALAHGLDLVQVRGLQATRYLLTHDVRTLEINEPLFVHAARSTAVALVGLQLKAFLRLGRTRVVSYAIENLDPAGTRRPAGVRAALAQQLDGLLMQFIWGRLDRIVYGTAAAEELYRRVMPARPGLVARQIPALPSPAGEASEMRKNTKSILFLGALVDRKGFRTLMEAWPAVTAAAPDAELVVLGKGPLQALAEHFAADHENVELVVDPPRDVIRQRLERAEILVLPAQPTAGWREQVGLPIVEGLSYGCTIVTTDETGLATWLAEHGHHVVSGSAPALGLASALLEAIRAPLPVQDVLGSLPAEDGRLAADRWLFEEADGARTSAPTPRPCVDSRSVGRDA